MKKTLLSIVLSVLVLFFGFVVVATTLDAKMSVPERACTEHVDEDGDKLCDVCGADLSCHHEFVEAEAEEATCSKEGHTAGLKCKLCGEWKEGIGEVLPKTEHTPGDFVKAKAPTCTETGHTSGYKCSVCGEEVVEELPLAPHTYQFVPAVDSTCEVEGVAEHYICIYCAQLATKTVDEEGNDVYVEIDAPDAIPCHHGAYVVTTPVDGLAPGVKTFICTDCHKVIGEDEAVAPIDVTVPTAADLNGRDGNAYNLPADTVNDGVAITLVEVIDEEGVVKYVYEITKVNTLDEATKGFYTAKPDTGAILLLTFADKDISTKGYTWYNTNGDAYGLVHLEGQSGVLDGEDYLYLFFNGDVGEATWTIGDADTTKMMIVVRVAAPAEEVEDVEVVALAEQAPVEDVAPADPAVDEGVVDEPVEDEVPMIETTFSAWFFGLFGIDQAAHPYLCPTLTYGSLALLVALSVLLGFVLAGKFDGKGTTTATREQRRALRADKKRKKAAKAQAINTKNAPVNTNTDGHRPTHMRF